MFEVTKYDPPHIFVTSRRTGETYMFLVENSRVVAQDGECFDHGDPHRAATAFLAQGKRSTTRDPERPRLDESRF